MPTFNSGLYNDLDLFTEIMAASVEYLDINSDNLPDKNLKIANAFANHIIRTRSDWKPQDITALFQFITDRKDIECNRIYGNKIMLQHLITSADAYEDERIDAREILHEHRKAKERQRESCEPTTDSPHYRELIARLNEKTKPKDFELPETTEPDRIQQALLNFDKLFYKKGKVINGIRFVEINGTFVNHEQYLKSLNEL